jgi:hypothetical protein
MLARFRLNFSGKSCRSQRMGRGVCQDISASEGKMDIFAA